MPAYGCEGTYTRVPITCNLPTKYMEECISQIHLTTIVILNSGPIFFPSLMQPEIRFCARWCLPDFTHTISKDRSATRRGVVLWEPWSNHQSALPVPAALMHSGRNPEIQAPSHSTSVGDARLPEQLRNSTLGYMPTPETLLVHVKGHHYICTYGGWDWKNWKGQSLTCIGHLMPVKLSGNCNLTTWPAKFCGHDRFGCVS